MKFPAGHARAVPALASLLLVPALMGVPSASGESVAPVVDDVALISLDEPLLTAPEQGRAAIRALGDELPVAAARNDLRTPELRALLRDDETVWLDQQGALYYVDPAPERIAPAVESQAVAPLADTFALHSSPGAKLTIFLDFDGHLVSGTQWNSQGVSAGNQPAWDPAGNGPGFTDAEKRKVQEIWAMVAEDYAPFGVDVTTQDPGAAGLLRSSLTDTVYGTRVLITPSVGAQDALCGGQCGGVAYLGVFDRVDGRAQPAWVFPQSLQNQSKAIAEAASHEAGHNLGLEHDGTASSGYYTGHGVWAPIMGAGYNRPLTQWSRGSYAGANNAQDDLAILTSYLGAGPDEASGSIDAPAALPVGRATIGTPADVDAYLLGQCAAGTVVQVSPASFGGNLDVRAVLHDASGAQRGVSQPASGQGDGITASGLGASLTVPSAGAGWVVTVAGVGEGAWASSGYDDYGSLGDYTVRATGCTPQAVAGAPSDPRDVTVSSGGATGLTLTWTPPAAPGSGPVTGYVVSRSDSSESRTLAAGARSHTFTGLAPGTTYQLSVRAVNAAGTGPAALASGRTPDPVPAAPSAPRDVVGSYDVATGRLHVGWAEPAKAGTQPIRGYAIHSGGTLLGELDATHRGVWISRAGGFDHGVHVVGVAAVNAVGSSPVVKVSIRVGPVVSKPSRMKAPTVLVRGKKAVVKWKAASANGAKVTRYLVDIKPHRAVKDKKTKGKARKVAFKKLKPGRYKVRVAARNSAGRSAWSGWVTFRVG